MHIDFPIEPPKYDILKELNGKCPVTLRENIIKDENFVPSLDDVFSPQEMWYADCYVGYIDADIEDKEAYIEEHFDELIAQAKGEDKASEIRAMRDELLAQSDKFMVFDRLGLGESTTFVSFLAKLKSILTGDIAKYRQALRDITKQEGFPYDVKFPEKPDSMK